MGDTLIPATPDTVRAAIAHFVLGAPRDADTSARLGAIELHPHQRDAVARLRTLLHDAGGALLADAVGLGKTYVALALARDALRPLVVAPASLRDMWQGAMTAADVHAPMASFEELSRRGPRAARRGRDERSPLPDFVIVDEAHHVRNPATRRYEALGYLTRSARVLLLTATPVHNRSADLAALLALVLGYRAYSLDDSDLARFVVRRDASTLLAAAKDRRTDRIPVVAPPVRIALPADDRLPESLLSLPPPLPARDAGDGGALVTHSLVRQWASSDAALRAALRRRLARARALESSLESGVHPTVAELRAWTSDGDSQQMVLAELFAPAAERVDDVAELRRSVSVHASAVRSLLATLAGDDSRDDARAAALLDVCARHPGERVVAFASYAETVDALFRRVRRTVPTAALTAAGARVAGGAITRREALARFAPVASGARPPRSAERVELLLATDLLSEGISLADASVVVHLDLPWTPARLEQRVGRAARLGAPHDGIAVYALAPPASAESMLRIEQRLREKLRAAGRVVGVAGTILPDVALSCATPRPSSASASASELAEDVRRELERWLGGGAAGEGVVAELRCGISGFVAACRRVAGTSECAREAAPLLLAALDGEATDDVHVVRRALAAARAGEQLPPTPDALDRSRGAIERWIAARAVIDATGIGDGASVGVRRRVIGRIAAIARRLPAHRRAQMASLAAGARRAALAPCGAGAEWVLEELARADMPDEAWLRAVHAFGASAAHRRVRDVAERVDVVALLLLVP